MTAARAALPDWPRLMSEEQAAHYLSISASTFRRLGIACRRIGRRVLYDRQDLDRYADRLDGQPLTPDEAAKASEEIERAFLRQRGRG